MSLVFNPFTGTFDFTGSGGGGGTPASPDTSVQFNNAGAFGGDSTITIEGSPLALVVTNMGSAFGSLAIPNNDDPFPYHESSNGLGVLQNNGAPDYDENTFLVATVLDLDTFTSSATILSEWATATTTQIRSLVVSGYDNSFDQLYWTGINLGGDFSGVNTGYLLGMNVGFSAEGNSPTGDVYGIQTALAISGTQRNIWNYWAANPLPFSGTADLAIHYYGASLSGGGTIANAYYVWFDSQGVYRIKEDATFNGVGQAIPTLYNPQFTKYTPGATDYERVILSRWNSNVAEMGPEAGGTGTLRGLRLIGASVEIPEHAAIGAASSPDYDVPNTLLSVVETVSTANSGILYGELDGTMDGTNRWYGISLDLEPTVSGSGGSTTLVGLTVQLRPSGAGALTAIRGEQTVLVTSTDVGASGAVGNYQSVEASAAATVPLLSGFWAHMAAVSSVAVTQGSGYYTQSPIAANAGWTTFTSFYSETLGGLATNPYSFWSDEAGVFRIKADNTFNSVYQAIPALYNPQFTKYTPGAANFERIILGQWNSNVAEMGNQAGGTGTLRALRLLAGTGLSVEDGSGNHVSVTASDFIMSGSALKTDTTNAHTGLIQAYDVDDATYRTFVTLTNANTPTCAISAPTGGTLSGNFTTLQIAGVGVASASNSVAFTNKTGNISQWTNDSGYLTSVTAHNVLSATHGDTLTASVVRGDVLIGNSTPKWSRLAIGSANKVLISDGTDIGWSSGLLSIASGKTFTNSNNLTLTATDGSTLAIGAGGTLGSAAYTASSAYEVPLTFSTGLTRSTNTVTVNTSQNIATLSNLTTNGFVKTGGGAGTLSVDTSTYLTTAVTSIATTSPISGGTITTTGTISLLVNVDYLFTHSQTITPGAAGQGGLTITGATETASNPALNITQTWNNSGVTFTASIINVTSTASAAASIIQDWQVGSTSVCKVDKTGAITNTKNGGGAYAIAISGQAVVGIGRNSSVGGLDLYGNDLSTPLVNVGSAQFKFGSSALLCWASGSVTQSADLILLRDTAQVLAQRNGTTAQAARIYNTFTSTTSYERLEIDWITTANVAMISTQKGSGGGTARVLQMNYGGTTTSAISVPITSGSITFGGKTVSATKNLSTIYTVATLPTGTEGDIAAVSDALAPVFLGALTGGGTVHTPVYYNGSAWVSF